MWFRWKAQGNMIRSKDINVNVYSNKKNIQPLIGTASQTVWLRPSKDQLHEKVVQPSVEHPINKSMYRSQPIWSYKFLETLI
jgi:hypothetical protein